MAFLGYSEDKDEKPLDSNKHTCATSPVSCSVLYPLVTSGDDFMMNLEHRLEGLGFKSC